MPKFFIALFLGIFLASCVQEGPANPKTLSEDDQLALENRIDQLELENALKDSVINESLAFFNEIRSNLEAIGIRKDEIRAISEGQEISSDDKQWILEEIQHINYLRMENAQMVQRLNKQLKESGVKINELEVMVSSLMNDIRWKDEQISMLQTELNNLDREYAALFDAYQEQALTIDIMTDEMNTVHYAYGTEKELIENGVIEKKNGFMGIGRKTELKDHINDDYFTSIDATKKNSILIEGKDIRIITYHPKSSYLVVEDGARTRIQIKDGSEFWKISKYLVVIVD